MSDIKKLLARIGTARDAIGRKEEQTSLDYMIDGVLMNCSVMLKEQEGIISALKFDLKETLEVVSEKLNVVRCKECKNSGMDTTSHPEYWCSTHSEYVQGDGFCSLGECKEGW